MVRRPPIHVPLHAPTYTPPPHPPPTPFPQPPHTLGLYVVNHAGEEEPWTPPSFSGYPSTGWGGDSGEGGFLSELEGAIGAGGFRAISSSSGAGHRSGVHRDDDGTVHRDVPRSTISTGYTSFLFAGDMTLGDQMFFINSPDYLLCPLHSLVGPCPPTLLTRFAPSQVPAGRLPELRRDAHPRGRRQRLPATGDEAGQL
jgi:hypothetical protein